MSAEKFLSRLEGVKRTGHGRWIARCPAHDDRRASLSIRELDDDRVLVHDFGGCNVAEVLGAAGLTFEALFPERQFDHHTKRERRPFNAYDILKCCAHESLVVAIIATDILAGKEVSETDRERLLTAAERMTKAAEVAHGRW